MTKLSTEATIGLALECGLAILERLHVREPLIIWGLFVMGLLLIFDSIIRGEWAEKIADQSRRRKKRTRMGTIAGVVFIFFGWWIYVRMNGALEANQGVSLPQTPQAQAQQNPPQPEPQVPAPTKAERATKNKATESRHTASANPKAAAGQFSSYRPRGEG